MKQSAHISDTNNQLSISRTVEDDQFAQQNDQSQEQNGMKKQQHAHSQEFAVNTQIELASNTVLPHNQNSVNPSSQFQPSLVKVLPKSGDSSQQIESVKSSDRQTVPSFIRSNVQEQNSQNPSQLQSAQAQSTETQNGSDEHKAEQFDSQLQYWLSCIGYCVGFGNIWRFPYLLFNNGGGAFLIPYLLSVFLLGIPMLYLETAFGQLDKSGLSEIFTRVNKRLWGFVYALFLINLMFVMYYVVLMAWSLAFLYNSFKNPLPWSESENEEQTTYFSDVMLEKSEDISQTGRIVPLGIITLSLSYVLLYFATFKGIKSTSKLVYVTAPLPYVLLTLLLVRGLTLEGASKGLEYLFVPDWSKLGELGVWKDAMMQVLYSTGISFGTHLYYAQCRDKKQDIVVSSFWIPVINSGTSIYASIIMFSLLGYLSHKKDIPINDLPIDGMELAFVAYPTLLTLLPWPNVWSIIFFVMLVTVGIDSVFGVIDFSVEFLYCNLRLRNKYNRDDRPIRKELIVFLYLLVSFLGGLIFTTRSGYFWVKLFDGYSCGLSLVFLMISETVIICWMYDLEKLKALVDQHQTRSMPKYYQIMTKYVIPVLVGAVFLVMVFNSFQNWLELPWWAFVIAQVLQFTPIVISLVGIVVPQEKIFHYYGQRKEQAKADLDKKEEIEM